MKWLKIDASETRVVAAAEQSLARRLKKVRRRMADLGGTANARAEVTTLAAAAGNGAAVLAAAPSEQQVEQIHALRVATRRARAALRVYEELLPPKPYRWWRKRLRRIRQAAAAARDADVRIAHLRQQEPAPLSKLMLDRLYAERAGADKPLASLIEDLPPRRLKRHTRRLLRQIPAAAAGRRQMLAAWAPARLQATIADFLEAYPDESHSSEELHQFRIRGKRLRYSIELLASAFPAALRRDIYPQLIEIQERLGALNDRAGWCEWLARWRAEGGAQTLDAGLAAQLDALLADERSQLQRQREAWFAWWGAVGPRLRRHLKRLARRQAA